MGRQKVVPLRKRGAARPGRPSAAAAAELAPGELALYGRRRAIDEQTYLEHASAIHEQFGVAADSLEIARLASRAQILASDHTLALRRIGRDYVALLVRHQAERQRFLAQKVPGMPTSYAGLADAVEAQHGDRHKPFRDTLDHLMDTPFPAVLLCEAVSFTMRDKNGEEIGKDLRWRSEAIRVDVQRQIFDEAEQRLLGLLRAIPHERPNRRNADTGLIETARRVAEWTRAHSNDGRADWQAVVRIMECHGWQLPGASVSEKARRLEDRVTRDARRNAQGTDPAE